MSAQGLSSRAIIGEYYKTLTALDGASWVNAISNLFTSDQESETYKWLGQIPQLQQWIGGRQAKGFRENGIIIENLHFEATIEVLVREMRRDKTGQVLARIRELARRTNSHWAKLISALMVNAESTVCYDGQYFFDTDHAEGDSGTQSNDIQVDISALPTEVHGTTTLPSVEEMQIAIVQGVQQILTFLDDQGEPFNEDATGFLAMVPTSFFKVAKTAVGIPMQVSASQTGLPEIQGDMTIRAMANPRLSWTDRFAIFRTDSEIKPFIRQQETDVMLKAVAEGSELEFHHDKHEYGVDTWRNAGYGLWQHACLVTLI